MSIAPAASDASWSHLCAQVRGMLGARLTNAADADDVAQEVLLRVFKSQSNLRDEERFAPWLAVMVRNAITDQLRERQRHPLATAGNPDVIETVTADVEPDEAARNRVAAALRPFAERLPAVYRETVILSELEGVPHAEIARRMSISVSGVKSRIQRGRDLLHRMLTDCCDISLDARRTVIGCLPKSEDAAAGCCQPKGSVNAAGCRPTS